MADGSGGVSVRLLDDLARIKQKFGAWQKWFMVEYLFEIVRKHPGVCTVLCCGLPAYVCRVAEDVRNVRSHTGANIDYVMIPFSDETCTISLFYSTRTCRYARARTNFHRYHLMLLPSAGPIHGTSIQFE